MNLSEDWDVIWRWQWFRRPTWEQHFADPTHPEGRTARVTPIWDWILKQYGAQTVLDCNSGIGVRSILLQESGFDMTGIDISPEATGYAQQLAAKRDCAAEFKCMAWSEVGDRFDQKFDATINDAFVWTRSKADLRFAFHNFAAALKPGGKLIFTGASQGSQPDERDMQLANAWQATPRFSLRSEYERDSTQLTLVIARDLEDHAIIENYLYVIRDSDGTRMETASICNTFQWTWEDFQHAVHEANFSQLESVKIPIGKRGHVVNVATR